MSSIFVFPGQGAQAVGMGYELYKNNKQARDVFDAVDDALGEKLSDLIFNGPMDELTMTQNVQPAIMATSIAMFKASGLELPEYVAGHSLGEYSALCAANAISIQDTAKILRLRGKLMQQAAGEQGGITAVVLGMDIKSVKEICDKFGCDVANDNCDGQVVISGETSATEKAMEELKNSGARRVMKLALSVPVHCRVQEKIVAEYRDALNKINFQKPDAKFISNKTCTPIDDVDEIKDALVYQMTHGVRWRESVIEMANLGITDMTEIGPGNVLTGLVNRITDKINAHKLEI
ncbi:MAG: ACP S-malonyltransferase [Alphaproteobacteria bacterium]